MPDNDSLLALMTMTASGCLPCQARDDGAALQRSRLQANKKAGMRHVSAKYASTTPASAWSGVIGVEGEMTGDGRLIEANALRWENLPLPLRYVAEDSGEHDGAVVVGTITKLSRGKNGAILGEGEFDLNSPQGVEAARQVGEKLTNGISMDLDDVSFEVRVAKELMEDDAGMMMPLLMASEDEEDVINSDEPAGSADEPEVDEDGRIKVMEMNADDEVRVTTDGRIRAATIVAIPAFASAQIYMAGDKTQNPSPADEQVIDGVLPDGTDCSCTEDEPNYDPDCDCSAAQEAPSAEEAAPSPPPSKEPVSDPTTGLLPDGETECSCDEADPEYDPDCDCGTGAPAADSADTLIAAAVPLSPPASWFSRPNFTRPTPLRVTEEGRVYGHLAEWHTCHTSHTAQGQCVMAPHSATGYAYFQTGSVLTADGAEVSVGHITLDTRHAGERLTPAATASHYEDTGTVVADVSAGEDEFGIWVSGALRPTVTANQVRALRSSPLSGDWRRVGSSLELVAALAVNVPGFPVPRPSGLVAGGQVRSLVASGMIPPRTVRRPGSPGALSMDDLRYLKRLADRERHEESVRAAATVARPAHIVPEDLSRRVRASAMAMRAHGAWPKGGRL